VVVVAGLLAGVGAFGVVGDPPARGSPAALAFSLRMVSPTEWNVPTVMSSPTSRAARRGVPQLLGGPPGERDRQAALGKTPSSAQRYAIRCVSVRVLPVPGPATISSGPPGAEAATRCMASRRSSRPVPTSSMPASIGSNGSCGDGGGHAAVAFFAAP
jgi:hypothetical protein